MFPQLLLAVILQDNLVSNGTFDSNAGGWTLATPGASFIATQGRSGGAVHLLSNSERPNSLEVAKWSVPAIPKGKALKLTTWVKGSNVKGMVSAAIQAWNASKTELVGFATTQKSTFLNGTFEWTKVETTLHPGPEATSAIILLILADKGEAWFDDVSLSIDGTSIPGASLVGAPGVFEIRGQTTYTATKDGA